MRVNLSMAHIGSNVALLPLHAIQGHTSLLIAIVTCYVGDVESIMVQKRNSQPVDVRCLYDSSRQLAHTHFT